MKRKRENMMMDPSSSRRNRVRRARREVQVLGRRRVDAASADVISLFKFTMTAPLLRWPFKKLSDYPPRWWRKLGAITESGGLFVRIRK
jgi:hypothetical protein